VITWEHLLQVYLEHLRGLRRSQSTLKNLHKAAGLLCRYCGRLGVNHPQQFTLCHFEGWVAELRARPYAPSTLYSLQRQMRTWLAWSTLQGHLLTNPIALCTPCKHPKILGGGAPSESQVLAMLNAPCRDSRLGQRDRAFLEFLYGTGLRRAECSQVLLTDLDLSARTLWVLKGKGDRSRQIPLGLHLAQILGHYIEQVRPLFHPQCDALWLNSQGQPLSPHHLDVIVRGYRKQCQLDKFSCHSFRHAYATHLLTRGAPLVALQRLLGHQTLTMTARYTHLIPLDLHESLLRHHPRGRRSRSPKS
jgi:site-specific recombinase XerD